MSPKKYNIDLIVHTKPMHEKFIQLGSMFPKEVRENGVVLYEKITAKVAENKLATDTHGQGQRIHISFLPQNSQPTPRWDAAEFFIRVRSLCLSAAYKWGPPERSQQVPIYTVNYALAFIG